MYRLTACALAAFLSCSPSPRSAAEQVWATERIMKTPESVLYDGARDVLYVSNINGGPADKDGNGFLSRLSTEGDILELQWITGLNAPKGMGLAGDRLYVSDIDELVAIDVAKGSVVQRYPVPGAVFCNDVAVDSSGAVYISDSSEKNGVIYRFDGGEVREWLRDGAISMPNGLCVDGRRLLVGSSGSGTIVSVDLSTRAVTAAASVGSAIDGLRLVGEGEFIVSDWRGAVRLVHEGGAASVLFDTTAKKINAADLEYVADRRLIVVPTFHDNRVVAYTLLGR
jgi:sugar lactone lactonase YvrE